MQLGQTAIQKKNIAEAVTCFTKALEVQPKDPQVLACLGQSLCWQGKREQGTEYLRQSGHLLVKKARKSRDTQLALDMVDQLHYWSDYLGALEVCKQAVQLNPALVRGFQ